MLQSYLKTAVRNLINHKMFSVINIGGLALGLAAAILIMLFVRYELSFDKFWTNADRLQRVELTLHNPGGNTIPTSFAPDPFAKTATIAFPTEIEQATRIFMHERIVVEKGDTLFREQIAFVDHNFFSLFDIDIAQGNRDATLVNANSIMISETTSLKYFGENSALDQNMIINDIDYTVTAIMKDLPSNTHLSDIHFVGLLDETRYGPNFFDVWDNPKSSSYLLLNPGISARELEARLPDFLDRNLDYGPDLNPSNLLELNLIAVPDSHLFSVREDGDIKTVYTFSLIAGLIILIACINFANLSTARSMQRAREVSLRKVMGARRGQVIAQFIGESMIITSIAFLLALVIVEFTLPYYNNFLGLQLNLNLVADPALAVELLVIGLLAGLLAGLYPAFLISGLRPVRILRSGRSGSSKHAIIRKALVTFQFAISIGLIIATLVISGQTNYARDIYPGYDIDNRLVLARVGELEPIQRDTLKAEILNIPGVEAASYSTDSVPRAGFTGFPYAPPSDVNDGFVGMETMTIDLDFFQTWNIQPLAGRLFSSARQADEYNPAVEPNAQATHPIIINQAAALEFGFTTPEAAIGAVARRLPGPNAEAPMVTIVGVIADIKLRSLRSQAKPLILLPWDFLYNALTIHINPEQETTIFTAIDALWTELVPDISIERSYAIERYDQMYGTEQRQGKMFIFFSLLATFIAGLGLFGLSAFAAEKRTNEIGVRKVFGASVADIVKLLVWQFTIPVLFSNLLAWPVAFYFMNEWLMEFSYRINLNVFHFVGAGFFVLLLAWMTVSGHAISIARMSPINALRHE
ncbi:MAG: FtsX-like permease family protein [Kordiimonadaceae bacterium]|nr:FtsX-like permease family protein [Kordiimonadaceae bacterium]